MLFCYSCGGYKIWLRFKSVWKVLLNHYILERV
nr:MAG TPA: hypothetical protein [Caudoviricetes sp.]